MGYSGMVSDSGSERMAGVRRIGGLSASMHRLTVSRCIPNSLAMPRIDRPFRLASCTAFHLSLCRKVGLPAGMGIVIFSGASSIASSSHSWDSSGICRSASVTAASGDAGHPAPGVGALAIAGDALPSRSSPIWTERPGRR